MSRLFRVASATLLCALVALTLLPVRASAHERRDVGKYQFVVGFIVEPAFAGQKNGVDLRVQLPGTPATPVAGLEKTLQVEITHVATGKSKTVPVRALFNDPGHYTADLIPTVPGQYRFRFFGTIEGTTVNEQFTSGDGFSSVEPPDAIQFPEQVAAAASIQGAARDAQATADDAARAATTARTLALVALLLAVASGGASAAVMLRRR